MAGGGNGRAPLEGLRRTGKLFVKSKIGVVGLAIILFFLIIAILAPQIDSNDPVFGTNVAAPLSVPAWATLLPQYQGLAVTSFPAPPVDFGASSNLGGWTLKPAPGVTVNQSISPIVPDPATARFLPRNPTGSLMLNATINSIHPDVNDTFLPGGQSLLTMSQTFQFTSKPPSGMIVNATIEPVQMTNVSSLYLEYTITTPTTAYNLSSTYQQSIETGQIQLLPKQVGTWVTSFVPAGLLQITGIPKFIGVSYPSKLIFSQAGTYTFTFQLQAVPSGASPKVSVRLVSLSLKVLGGAFGPLGTDDAGRDIWAQFVWGSRISLLIGILSGIGAVGLGTLLGIAAGYLGGFWDEALGRVTDFVLVLPFLPLLIILTFILSQNAFLLKTVYTWVILLFTVLTWPTIAKIIRAQVLSVKERPYIEASHALGGSTGHVLRKHILPNVTGLVYSQVALAVSGFILLEAALDFLTVSVYPVSVTSWGIMLTNALPDATANSAASYVWWWFLPPGIAIALLSLAFVLVGFALDSIFNPRLRAR